METSSSCKSRDEVGLELEDMMSDLHALKALYGLLHKGDSKIPPVNSNSHDSLDEKSKNMLKKLLDGATQQALQCQAKIVTCTQGEAKAKRSHRTEGIENGIRSADNVGKCHSALHYGQVAESQSPLAPSQQNKEQGIQRPVPEHERQGSKGGDLDLARQKSERISGEKLDRMTKEGSSNNRHRRIHRDCDGSSEVKNKGRLGAAPDPETTGGLLNVQARREAVPSGARLKALSQKCRRVEAAEPPGQSTSRIGPRGRAEGQSANRKPSDERDGRCGALDLRCSRTKSALSRRTGSLVDGRTKRTSLPDRTAENVGLKNKSTDEEGPTVLMPRRKEQGHSIRKDEAGPLSGRRFIKPEKPPRRHHKDPSLSKLGMPPIQLISRVGRNHELSQRAVRNERQTPRQTKGGPVDQVGPKRRKHPTTTPNRMRSIRYSSPSLTTGSTDTTPSRRTCSSTRSDSSRKPSPCVAERGALVRRAPVALSPPMARRMSSHRALVPMRAATARDTSPLNRAIHRRIPREKQPRRMLSHHGPVGPPHAPVANAKPGQQKKREGRLRMFKDKLAIIFHHHHHHHHHLHAGHVGGDDTDDDGLKHHHRSPWEYLRRILHHTSKEDHGKLVTGRRAPTQHQNGYLHALLEGLLRHVWGTKERRAAKARRRRLEKAASRVGPKKLHWWQRIGKGRGVKLANRKKPRIKLGFARENRRATKKV